MVTFVKKGVVYLNKAFGSIMAFLLLNALLFYMGWNGWVWLSETFSLNSPFLFWVIFIVLNYAYLLARGHNLLIPLRIVGACWLAIVQYSLLLLPFINLVVWLLISKGFDRTIIIVNTGYLYLLFFAVLFAVGLYNAYQPVVRKYQVTLPKRSGKRSSLRIAMASDMHFGILAGKSLLTRMVNLVKGIKPDIILLPGDIIDDEPFQFMRKNMGDVMKEMKAPLGIYATLGNHEYYGNRVSEFLDEMKRIGVQVLLDEVALIDESFYLVGRKDKHDHDRESFADLLSFPKDTYPIIAMDHQPTEISIAADLGVHLLLSGHTHRGQMFPNHLVTKRMFENDYGHYQKGTLHSIVSSGFGFWGPPIRIGSRSELLQIDINFE